MARRTFDLGSVAALVSDLDTKSAAAAPSLQLIPLDKIITNDKNLYGVRDLDALKDSIAMEGLQQPLIVTPQDDGTYLLISGHRRREAIRQLVEDPDQPRPDLRLVPCSVKTYSSPEAAELALIQANATTRVLTDAEKAKQAERVQDLLYQLKEQGYDFPGRMRDHVAEVCQISKTKLARLQVIRHGLDPSWIKSFDAGLLSEQAAYALARMPADFQARLAKVTGCAIKGYNAEGILTLYEKGDRWESELICPNGKPCTHADAFLRHDIENYPCHGTKCCLDCEEATRNYGPCPNMCSKAKKARQDANKEAEARQEKRQEANRKKADEETKVNARRLLPVVEAAGLSDKQGINLGWRGTFSVGKIRAWADGRQLPHIEVAQLTPRDFSNADLSQLIAATELLHCTADFLLGLTDQPYPMPTQSELRWSTGTPKEDGLYAVREAITPGNMFYSTAYWRREKWRSKQGTEVADTSMVTGWIKLPEKEEQ